MIDKKILDRYLAGNGTHQDKIVIIEWFSSIKEESSLRKVSMPVWENQGNQNKLSKEKSESLLDRIHHRIRLKERPAINEHTTMVKFLRILSRVAAVLFIPLVIYMWTLRDQIFDTEDAQVYSEIKCPPGTRTMFHLPDGSHGWLNGGSSLEFPHEFKDKSRQVQLTGEGFFNIKSNPLKPFIVNADHIQVKAYGTSFNVFAYPTENITEVALVEGKVEVVGKRNGMTHNFGMLDQGQMCLFDHRSFRGQIGTADIEKATSWINGRLIFRDDNFNEVVDRISRWYNVNMVISDKELESYTYVGTFQDETLEEILKLLSLTAPIDYRDLGRKRKEDGTFEKRMIELKLKQ